MNAPAKLAPTVALADLREASEVARIESYVEVRGGSVFHRPRWLQAVEHGTGQRALGLVARRGDAIAGWLPLSEVRSPLFGNALVSSGFAVGGGPLAESGGIAASLCRAAEEVALRRSAPTIELRGGNAPDDWHSTDSTHCSFAGPLADDDEAQLLAIPRKARAEVRKGLSESFTVTVGSGGDDRAAHYACYAESVRNLGTPVFPRRLFEAVLEVFGKDADVLTVRHDGRPIASVLSLYHRGTVMPYWGGGTQAARGLRANERMYYELMCHGRRRGCARFDFGRSKTASGPYFFKKNWGFEPKPLTYSSWSAPGTSRRNIDPTDSGYSARVALWKKLPLPLANALGPFIARGLG